MNAPVSTTLTGPPVVTFDTPADIWTQRRYYVDGREVVKVSPEPSRIFRCSPDHRQEYRGVTSIPIGEHVPGCEWVAIETSWGVHLSRSLGSGRYYGNLADAYAAAEKIAESARRCSLPVRARLCRLLKRHDGPCIPWD